LQNLRPGSDYNNLYMSARARSHADYVVGYPR
jgi:DNA topoisomerase-3